MAGIYSSEYSGPEIDKAVGKILGNYYGESNDPGCHLIGKEEANPQNLYDVRLPGKYTILFFYDADANGPISLSNIATVPSTEGEEAEYASIEGNSPIFMTVTYSGNHLYQRITIGAALFWRDLLDSANHHWTYVNMGVTQTVIVDHLHSTSPNEALSGNMGRELKHLIDSLDIGNMNLIHNSALMRDSTCWNIPTYDTGTIIIKRDDATKFFDKPTFSFSSEGYSDSSYVGISNAAAFDCPADRNMTYTASVYVNPSIDMEAYIQVEFIDKTKTTTVWSGTQKIDVIAGTWRKISVTVSNTVGVYARISFGYKGNGTASFALPKLEVGAYATQWMPSYYDMWREFDNANFINEVLVDTDNLKQFDGIFYDETEDCFINYPAATGGGGGFVQSETEPEHHEVLWYKLDKTANRFYRYNKETSQWERATMPFFHQEDDAPIDTERGWLDTRKASSSVPATLNYYDKTLKSWRAIGAAPGVNWVFSDTPPENTGLIWIHTPNFIMKLWYDGAWVPIHAIWGTNITST